MLENIREHAQGWIAKLILALITVPFALWGIDSYFKGSGKEQAVASVGSEEIGQREFFKALQARRDTIQQQTHQKVDIEDKDFRKQVLDQIIDSRLIAHAAQVNHIMVQPATVESIIQSEPTFQENGAFSPKRFQEWLGSRGLSKQELVSNIQRTLLAQQVQVGYGEGSVTPKASVKQLAGLMAQQREVSQAVFKATDYLKSIKIDDKAVQAEYDSHKQDYAIPEQVKVQYLVLSEADVEAATHISDDQAQQFYQANKDKFQEPEQRHASHILIATDSHMSQAQLDAAKAKADKLYQEVVANPGRFAELAKTESQDPGSAVKGGDLGSFTHDAMVKPFADAAFSMKVGDISKPVKSEFGYHIIRLDGITLAKELPFASVKADIVAQLAQSEAGRKFADSAEKFGNVVYEQADSLESAAKQFNLKIQESGWISRQQANPPLLGKPELLDAMFLPDSVQKHQNTEAIEVAPNTLVSAHVIDYKPAGVRPLSEVADNIRAKLALQAARAKAIEAGGAALKQAQGGQAVAGMGAPMEVSRLQPMNLPPEGLQAVFKADIAKLPVTIGAEVPDGYAVYRIGRVTEAAFDAGKLQGLQRELGGIEAREELKAYLAYIKAKEGVKINEAVLEKKAE